MVEVFHSPTVLGVLNLASLLFSLAMWPAILLSRKQPVAMLAWLFGVTFLPVVGPLFFLAFGRERRLPALPRKKLRADRRLRARLAGELGPDQRWGPRREAIPAALRAGLRVAERVGSHPQTAGNALTLLDGAAEKYPRLLADVAGARDHVHLEYYIFRADRFGSELGELLMERARAGVEVRLLLDGVGSLLIRRRFLRRLQAAGVQFAWFHPLNPFKRWSLNIRNHRKIAVIDGQVAYVGGINVGDEYLGRSAAGDWHDLSLRMAGPAAQSLQRVFIEDWHFASGEVLAGRRWFPETPAVDDGVLVQIVESYPSDELVTELHQVIFALISAARRQAWLVSPYFLPDETIQTALANRALGGVDVRVLTPARTDERTVDIASRSYFAPLLESGVRIFCFPPDAVLHAKALLVDGTVMVVGSANLDQRSLRLSFETGALIHDRAFGRVLQDYLERKMALSRDLSLEEFQGRPWYHKTVEAVARLAAPLF